MVRMVLSRMADMLPLDLVMEHILELHSHGPCGDIRQCLADMLDMWGHQSRSNASVSGRNCSFGCGGLRCIWCACLASDLVRLLRTKQMPSYFFCRPAVGACGAAAPLAVSMGSLRCRNVLYPVCASQPPFAPVCRKRILLSVTSMFRQELFNLSSVHRRQRSRGQARLSFLVSIGIGKAHPCESASDAANPPYSHAQALAHTHTRGAGACLTQCR